MSITLNGKDRGNELSPLAEYFAEFPLIRLLPPDPDIRDRESPEYRAFFEQLVADISEHGVQQPVVAFREGEMAHVIDGWTRCLASLMARKATIQVLLHPTRPDAKDRLLGSLQSNAMRLDMDDFEYAAVYQQLMDECEIATQCELAALVKASPSLVSKRLNLLSRIPPDIRSLFGRGPGKLGGRAGHAIGQLTSDDDKREIARLAVGRGLLVKNIESWCRGRIEKKPKRPRAMTIKVGGVAATITGNPVEALRAFIAKATDAMRRLEKEGLPAELLPALLK